MQKLLGYMRKAIQEFDMISDGDVIAVGVSGGKDSLVLLNGLVLLRRFIGIDYRIVSITLDPQFGGIPGNYQPIAGTFGLDNIKFVFECSFSDFFFRCKNHRSDEGDILS